MTLAEEKIWQFLKETGGSGWDNDPATFEDFNHFIENTPASTFDKGFFEDSDSVVMGYRKEDKPPVFREYSKDERRSIVNPLYPTVGAVMNMLAYPCVTRLIHDKSKRNNILNNWQAVEENPQWNVRVVPPMTPCFWQPSGKKGVAVALTDHWLVFGKPEAQEIPGNERYGESAPFIGRVGSDNVVFYPVAWRSMSVCPKIGPSFHAHIMVKNFVLQAWRVARFWDMPNVTHEALHQQEEKTKDRATKELIEIVRDGISQGFPLRHYTSYCLYHINARRVL